MTKAMTILLVGVCAIATPVASQTQSGAPAATTTPPVAITPAPNRIAAARELLDILMPPDQRVAMVTAMIEPMVANLQAGMMQSPQLESAAIRNPEVQALFTEFMATQRTRVLESATANLPSMIEAVSRAYARRFTRREMREIGEFFETDSGQAYLHQADAIMVDPDVAAWQRETMAQSMQYLQTDIPDFMARLSAIQGGGTPAPPRGVTNSNLDAMRGGTQAAEPETEE